MVTISRIQSCRARWFLTSLPIVLFVAACLCAPRALADSTTSYTGTLSSPEDYATETLTLTASSTVVLQTWSFGGGTNGSGTAISAGGFDPLLAIFSGTGSGAEILTDSLGDAIATADTFTNFSSFMGCPPAGQVDIGGDVCGDITMSLTLDPGTYTFLLSDANYIPVAVDEGAGGELGDGFFDLTGGAFQTCNVVGSTTTCADDTANWAFDVTTSGGGGGTAPAPEPATLILLGMGLLSVGADPKLRDKLRRL
ncbi:MAG TPA: DVUA0089 family protein [Candidatus Acidoferrum sp.]|nr:DVUA0089 family protein [Candidatus Acidoferrum sp.]